MDGGRLCSFCSLLFDTFLGIMRMSLLLNDSPYQPLLRPTNLFLQLHEHVHMLCLMGALGRVKR
jgi:hypothetical protein